MRQRGNGSQCTVVVCRSFRHASQPVPFGALQQTPRAPCTHPCQAQNGFIVILNCTLRAPHPHLSSHPFLVWSFVMEILDGGEINGVCLWSVVILLNCFGFCVCPTNVALRTNVNMFWKCVLARKQAKTKTKTTHPKDLECRCFWSVLIFFRSKKNCMCVVCLCAMKMIQTPNKWRRSTFNY